MHLSKDDIRKTFDTWLQAWDNHYLDGVMAWMHNDVVFENWDGSVIKGKTNLRRAWMPWFLNHGNFKFTTEDVFIDEVGQKILFRWLLDWPSLETGYKGKPETRRGVDVLHLHDGQIISKLTYSKTSILIDSTNVSLQAIPNPIPIKPSSK